MVLANRLTLRGSALALFRRIDKGRRNVSGGDDNGVLATIGA